MTISPTEIIFSPDQQLGLLGHAMLDPKVFEAATLMGVTDSWFNNSNQQSIWSAMEGFEKVHRRLPSIEELKSTQAFTTEEPRIVKGRLQALDHAGEMRQKIGFDSIVTELREWAKGQRFLRGMTEADEQYSRKDVAAAYQTIGVMNTDIEKLDKASFASRAEFASTRVKDERKDRLAQATQILNYGVTYLDDSTGGIIGNEVVIIGAKAGVGKTQLVTRIAGYNATKGVRVALFALEAEPYEIERRIKYALLSRAYRAKVKNPIPLDYRAWRQGKLENELGGFEEWVNQKMEAYKTLKTIYRHGGNYAITELERDILRVAPETDLIIIDHLHYIDTDGNDDNFEMKRIVKMLRDMALVLGKPIVLVAHMRKTMGGRKNAPLVPDLEDFHGSSDIVKIATTAIILAPCYTLEWGGVPPADFFFERNGDKVMHTLWATYMRVAKFRLDGSITRYCGVGFFDPSLGTYRKEYAIGKLVSADCHWEPDPRPPYWATNGTVGLLPTNT